MINNLFAHVAWALFCAVATPLSWWLVGRWERRTWLELVLLALMLWFAGVVTMAITKHDREKIGW